MAWQFYTKGRRVPTLIGKDSAGRRIPGGPYTGLQFLAMPGIPALLWYTRGLWAGSMSILGSLALAALLTFGGVKLLGLVDFAARNPLYVIYGYLKQVKDLAPAGRCAGRKLAPQRICRIRSRINTATRIALGPTIPNGDDRDQPAMSASAPPPRNASENGASADGEIQPINGAPPLAAIQPPTMSVRMSALEAFLEEPATQPEPAMKESVS